MPERHQTTATPQSSTLTSTPSNSQYTPHATSLPDDSETEFSPTPLHSPGGPQYEDLPPSYDFALNDAQNGVASLDASQIEAHRVSANEGPDEPEVWEYRMRGEGAGEDEEFGAGHVEEGEDAPAYEGHVPVQHVRSSESIPVGRVGDSNAASTLTDRRAGEIAAPLYSVSDDADANPAHGIAGGRQGQQWSPFGAPGCGPFGAPGNGPFGAPGAFPFGRGRHFVRQGRGGHPALRGRHGRGRGGRGARSGPAQDWVAFGQNLGRMGEDFGRRMGSWGEQFGRQAGAMGEQMGRQVGAMGQQIGRDTGAWASAYSGRAVGAQSTHTAGPSHAERSEPPQYGEPPSYQASAGAAGQETGALHSDRKVNTSDEKASEETIQEISNKALSENKPEDYDYDSDSDSSSVSSASTSSSSSSSDDGQDAAQITFLSRLASINAAAELAFSKGRKPADEIANERDLAIAKATREKEDADLDFARKQSRRTQKRHFRARKRELASEYRRRKMEVKSADRAGEMGKGKAKKGKEVKDVKREYKAEKRELKRERVDAKRAWKREKREGRKARRKGAVGSEAEGRILDEKTWESSP